MKHPEFVADFDLDVAVVEDRLEQVPMRVVLWLLHLKLIGVLYLGADYGPKGLELTAHAEDHVEEVHRVEFGVLLFLLLELFDPDLLHAGLRLWVEGLPHVDLDVLAVPEYLSAEIALVVAVDLPDDPGDGVDFRHGLDVGQLGDFDDLADVAHVDPVFLHDLAEVRAILDDEVQVVQPLHEPRNFLQLQDLGSLGDHDVLLFPLLVIEGVSKRASADVGDVLVHLDELADVLRTKADVLLVDAPVEIEVDGENLINIIEVDDLVGVRLLESRRVEVLDVCERVWRGFDDFEAGAEVDLHLLVVHLGEEGLEVHVVEDDSEGLHEHEVDLPVVHAVAVHDAVVELRLAQQVKWSHRNHHHFEPLVLDQRLERDPQLPFLGLMPGLVDGISDF